MKSYILQLLSQLGGTRHQQYAAWLRRGKQLRQAAVTDIRRLLARCGQDSIYLGDWNVAAVDKEGYAYMWIGGGDKNYHPIPLEYLGMHDLLAIARLLQAWLLKSELK